MPLAWALVPVLPQTDSVWSALTFLPVLLVILLTFILLSLSAFPEYCPLFPVPRNPLFPRTVASILHVSGPLCVQQMGDVVRFALRLFPARQSRVSFTVGHLLQVTYFPAASFILWQLSASQPIFS